MHAIRIRPNLVIATIMMTIAASPIFAVGTVTQAVSPIGRDPGSNPDTRPHQITINWTADAANGSVPATAVNLGSFPAIQGMRLVSFEAKPGSPAPTNNYTITLTDTAGVDLLAGAGAALSNVNSASLSVPNMQAPIVGGLTFNLSGNAVNGATGSVYIYFAPIAAALTAPGAAGTTTNNTFTGTNTFSGVVAGNPNLTWTPASFGANCTVAALQASILAATPTGGTVDYRSCTTISSNITNTTGSVSIPASVIVLLGPSTWTCAITTANTPCWFLTGSGAQLIGAGEGDTGEGVDPALAAAKGQTNFLCSSCGTTTDMVRVAIPNSARLSLATALIFANKVSGLYINMGNSGRDAVYITSTHKGDYSNINAFNVVGTGLHIEADCANGSVCAGASGTATNQSAESYNWTATRMWMQPIATNSTNPACFLDAQNGEIAYFKMDALRCRGNFQTGGGSAGLLMQTTTCCLASIDSGVISNSTLGDPSPSATNGGYGVQMKGTGTWPTGSAGTINNVSFNGILLEHQFGPAAGIGIECTNGSNVAGGAACGSITLYTVNSGGWTTGIDRPNLGESHAELATSLQDFGSPALRASGSDTGPNAQFLRIDGQANATAINQTSWGANLLPSFHDKGFSGQTAYGLEVAPLQASGATPANFTTWAAAHFDGSGLPNGYGFRVTNSLGRFDTGLTFSETTPFGAGAAFDTCYGDSTAHSIKCSYNNGSFGIVPNGSAGTYVPITAGGTDLGSTTLPFGNLWLGSSSTSQFKIAPASTSAARIITLPDPGSNANMVLAPCITSQRSESAADANLLTCPIVAAAGSYRIRFMLDISAANAATLGWTATWTDSNGSADAPTNLAVFTSGSATPTLTVTTSVGGQLYGYIDVQVNNSATSIVVKLTFSGTSFTAKATATVERIV